MESDKIELAEILMGCVRWRWVLGMTTSNGGRILAVDEDGSCLMAFGAEEFPFWCTPETMSKMTPNLTDPATGGCILTLINLEYLDTIILFKPNVWHIRINKIKDDLFTGCLGEAAARAIISLENV
jgi:hypothetical protein